MYVFVYDALVTTNLSLYVKMLCIRTYYLLNITYYNTYYEALPNKCTLFKLFHHKFRILIFLKLL